MADGQQRPAADPGVDGIDVVGDLEALATADPHLTLIKAFDLEGLDKVVPSTAGVVALGEAMAARSGSGR